MMNSRDKSVLCRRLRAALFVGLLGCAFPALAAGDPAPSLIDSVVSSDQQRFEEVTGIVIDGDVLRVADAASGRLLTLRDPKSAPLTLGPKSGFFGGAGIGSVVQPGKGRIAVVRSSEGRVAVLDAKGEILASFAASGSEDGRLRSPSGLAYSSAGRYYIADTDNGRVPVFTADGLFLFNIGVGELKKPVQVSVDADERVYVLERGGRVIVFDRAGALLKRIEPGQLRVGDRPPEIGAIVVAKSGDVIAADKANGKIIVWDWRADKLVLAFGSKGAGRGQFARVTALALADDRLAVGDSGNRKVEVYRLPLAASEPREVARLPSATWGAAIAADCERAYPLPEGGALCLDRERGVARIGADGTLRGHWDKTVRRPVAAAIDMRDIAIIDGEHVKLFDHKGRLRFSIGRSGSGDGEFDQPQGVALGDKLYVADTGNRRVQIFSRDGVFLDKIANVKGQSELLQRPAAIAVDAQGNIYVGDNGLHKVRVFSDRKLPLFDLGQGESSRDRFDRIRDLAVDKDDNLYVLASTPMNSSSIRVYNGPKQIFAFGAHLEQGPGFSLPSAIGLTVGTRPAVAVQDSGRRRLQLVYFDQVPGRIAGLSTHGDLTETRIRWQKSPSSFVARYRVYGAGGDGGEYRRLADVADDHVVIKHDGVRYTRFRVAGVSSAGIEGPLSSPRDDLFQAGYAQYQAKKYDEAVALFNQAYAEDATDGTALEYVGRSLSLAGKTAAAVSAFQDLARIPGFETKGADLQAETLLQSRQFLQARAVLEQTIAVRHTDAVTYSLCGETALALGDNVRAVDCLEESLKQDNKNADAHFALGRAYIALGATDKGVVEYEAAVTLAPNDARAWQRSGEAYAALGRQQEAIARFNKALALDPLNGEVRLDAARSYIAIKDYDRARSIALSMSSDAAQEASGQYLLGVIAQAMNQPQEALVALSRSCERDPKNTSAWLALADVQIQLGNRDKTKDALRRAAQTDPQSYDAQYRLAQMEQADGDSAAAAAALAKAVAARPGRFDARLLYAQVLLVANRYKDASDQAKEAARLAPKRVEPLTALADAAHAQGKNGDAIDYLKRALAIEPTSTTLTTQLGRMYLENSVYDEAQTYLEKATLLDARNADAYDLLGQMYMERRLFDPAIKAFGRAAAIDPRPEIKLHLNTAYAEKKRSLEFAQNAPRIVLEDLRLARVFSSAYKQYAQQPVAQVKVRNLSGSDYKNLRLSFHIKGYMDFPSVQEIPVLAANQTLEFALPAAFNNKILGIDEDTGVQAEAKLSFVDGGQQSFADLTRPMTIYGKNAIQWANFAMVGSFITPKDDVLKDFVRRTVNQYAPTTELNKNMVRAMTLFDVLSAYGLKYLPDPNSPYSRINAEQVDYVEFPRETLKVKSGDCDDLSVLLSAGLENLGMQTALVDVPGHLFLMFDTGVPETERERISVQDDLLVIRDKEVWIPLEATMISTSFSEAWAEGARRYREAERAKTVHVVEVKDAWTRYAPATLSPAGYTLDIPAADKVGALIDRERRILVTKSLERMILPYRAMLKANPADQTAALQIGIIYAQNGLFDLALKEFDRILQANPRSSEARNDRGNVYYMMGDYERALDEYRYAEQVDPADGGIKINIAMSQYQRGRLREANDKFQEGAALNKTLATRYKAFAKLLLN